MSHHFLKIFSTILFCCWSPSLLWSQDEPVAPEATLKWGEAYKEFPGSILADYIGLYENTHFILKGELDNNQNVVLNKRFYIDGFDQELNRIHRFRARVEVDHKVCDPEFVLVQNGDLQLYSSLKNYRANKSTLFRHRLNLKSGEPEYPGEEVGSTPITSASRASNFSFKYSRDSSTVLIYGNARNRRTDPEQFTFVVQDREGGEIWQRSVTLPYEENLFEVEDVAVSGEGAVFLLGRRYQERVQEKRKGRPNYEYHLLAYYGADSEPREYVINVTEKFLTEMMVDVSTKGKIICAGFYSEKGTISIMGSYYLKLDPGSGEIVQSNFSEFGSEAYFGNKTDREKEKMARQLSGGKKRELYRYQLKAIVPRGDGGAVVIAEQFYTRTVMSGQGNLGRPIPQTEYNYHSLIVVSISPEGQIEWMSKVPKKQSSVMDLGYYSSFQYTITPQKIYFVYNDDIRNLDRTEWRKFVNYVPSTRKGIVCLASVDAEGNVQRSSLMKREDMETKLVPRVGEQISPYEAILFGKRWKDTQVGRVVFE